MRAADVMTRDPITVRPDTSIRNVIELLRSHRISGLPVVSNSGGLVGVVSESDLMHKAAAWPVSPHPDFPLDRVSEQLRERSEALCVADVMTAAVVSVDART